MGCGLDWRLPVNHFDGVSAQGYVAYWEKIADLELDGMKVPIVIGFRSNMENGTPSPYLGSGWTVPLLEASFIQTGENTFVMMQPDGWNNRFQRMDDTTLRGSAGWMARITGDTITAWARCGWRLEFYKGRIIAMITPQNQRLDYMYDNGVATEIRENGGAKLTVERDAASGQAEALVFDDRAMEIKLGQKPRVQSVSGQNLVSGMDQSLNSITPSDGPAQSFEFSVNVTVQPTLKVIGKSGSERLFAWDPRSKRIVSDGQWKYDIAWPDPGNPIAAITRTNVAKQIEYWYYDGANGREFNRGADGVMNVKYWFLSGVATGRVRKVDAVKDGKTKLLLRNVYDENGKLIESVQVDGATTWNHRAAVGRKWKFLQNQNGEWQYQDGDSFMRQQGNRLTEAIAVSNGQIDINDQNGTNTNQVHYLIQSGTLTY